MSFGAQSAYTRILTRVDDFGQFDGRPAVILGECWSVWNALHPDSQVTLETLVRMLSELVVAGLTEFWDGENGKLYVQITQWQERVRVGCKPKWREESIIYSKLSEITTHTGTGVTASNKNKNGSITPAQARGKHLAAETRYVRKVEAGGSDEDAKHDADQITGDAERVKGTP